MLRDAHLKMFILESQIDLSLLYAYEHVDSIKFTETYLRKGQVYPNSVIGCC